MKGWLWIGLLGAACVALVWLVRDVAPPGEEVGPARWFVAGPGGVLAVGRPDGDLVFLDHAGRQQGETLRGGAAAEVVFLADGTAVVLQRRGGEWRLAVVRDGTAAPAAARLELGPGDVPRLLVPAGGGPLSASAPVLVTAGRTGVHRLFAFAPGTGAIVDATAAPDPPWEVLSLGPQGLHQAVIRPGADRPGTFELVRRGPGGVRTGAIQDVAPVPPVWLGRDGALIAEGGGDGLLLLGAAAAEPIWIAPGRLPRRVARATAAVGPPNGPFLVERVGPEGDLELLRVAPSAGQDVQVRRATTGRSQRYGLTGDGTGRHAVFRRGVLDASEDGAAVDEEVVWVDFGRGGRSAVLVRRRVSPAADRIGPTFVPEVGAVYAVARDVIWRWKLP